MISNDFGKNSEKLFTINRCAHSAGPSHWLFVCGLWHVACGSTFVKLLWYLGIVVAVCWLPPISFCMWLLAMYLSIFSCLFVVCHYCLPPKCPYLCLLTYCLCLLWSNFGRLDLNRFAFLCSWGPWRLPEPETWEEGEQENTVGGPWGPAWAPRKYQMGRWGVYWGSRGRVAGTCGDFDSVEECWKNICFDTVLSPLGASGT